MKMAEKRDLKADLDWMMKSPSDHAKELEIAVHALERAIEAESIIAEIVGGLAQLSCTNHSCHFNPPKGMGTNGGCSCLSGLPPKLRLALTLAWAKSKTKEVLGDE
jgi:hypothetical protein